MTSQIDFLRNDGVKRFIQENLNTDTNKLLLNPPKEFKSEIGIIANQIIARQKAKGKLKDWAANFNLVMPAPLSIEQASSDSTSAFKRAIISGNHLVDLTGGMGIDCLALSAEFKRTTYVEKNENLCHFFKHNSTELNREIEIVNSKAEHYLVNGEFDPKETSFFLDPARRDQDKNRVFRIEDCSPNLIEIMSLLERKGQYALVKYSPFLDIKAITSALKFIKEIHVVSVKNDCKELLLLLDFTYDGTPKIICSNLESGQHHYSFSIKEEDKSIASLGSIGKYLLEPNTSIMKAGAFNKIAVDFNIDKIGENTHFYTSDEQINEFPGRVFEILAPASKESLKEYTENGKINVMARNHPITASEIKKKWKVKDGGPNFLIAFRDWKGKARMLIAKRVDL